MNALYKESCPASTSTDEIPMARSRAAVALHDLHAAAAERHAQDEAQVNVLKAGLTKPSVAFVLESFGVDHALQPRQRPQGAQRGSATDLPVLQYEHTDETLHPRVSVPLPFVEPMVPSGPSARRADEFVRSMRGESMAIEAHLAFDAETPASRRARLQATRVC